MSRKTYKGAITQLKPNQIFVFGSNTQGRHGKGAAKWALNFGALYGRAKGLYGNSYGIITKDLTKKLYPSITRQAIEFQIRHLYKFAIENPDKEFLIAYSGTGKNLNGYTNKEMADMFSCTDIPDNIVFEEEFNKLIKYD